MLEKMKGQGQSMVAIAMKACAIAFKAVQRIGHVTKNYKIEWEYLPGALDITVADESREYEFVRGSFLFSPKACADSKAEDFSAPKELPINGKFVTTLDPWPLRMKTLELIGYYK